MVNKMFVSVMFPVLCFITFSILYILHSTGRGRILEWKVNMKPLFSLHSEVHVNSLSNSGCNMCKLKVQ